MTRILDAVDLASRLIQCPSVTPKEGGALDYLESILSSMGFECFRMVFSEDGTPDVDNLFARLGNKAPHVCFAGHTDVVPPGDEASWSYPPFSGITADGAVYGRGASDMKGGIACFVAAVSRVLEGMKLSEKGSISLLITGDEEGPSINGTEKVLKWMENNNQIPDLCIVGEPTNPKSVGDMIKIGRRGCVSGQLVVKGQRGHVAYAHLANNPIPGLCKIVDGFHQFKLDSGTPHFEPSHLEFTTIDVNNPADNVIPETATAQFNIRFNDLQTTKKLDQELRALATHILQGSGLSFQLTFDRGSDAFLTTPGPELETFENAIRAVTGSHPERSTTGGTSDARFIRRLCPVFEFGLVNETIHQIDENARFADIHALTKVYEKFLTDYLA